MSKIHIGKKAILIIGICIAGAVIIFLAKPQRTALSLPKSILQLYLNEEIRGEEAREIVDKMHRKSVTPDENAVGIYRSSNGSATLYISCYKSSDVAVKQFEKMAGLILEEQGGVFTHFREVQTQGKKVYLCLGLEQAHYFFLTGKYLYWLSIDPPIAQASMQELVRIVNIVK